MGMNDNYIHGAHNENIWCKKNFGVPLHEKLCGLRLSSKRHISRPYLLCRRPPELSSCPSTPSPAIRRPSSRLCSDLKTHHLNLKVTPTTCYHKQHKRNEKQRETSTKRRRPTQNDLVTDICQWNQISRNSKNVHHSTGSSNLRVRPERFSHWPGAQWCTSSLGCGLVTRRPIGGTADAALWLVRSSRTA